MSRRQFLKIMIGSSLATAMGGSSTFAQGVFPSKPLWLVVPWPAGAGTDIAARAVADALAREFKQPVQVDNRPGASGAIGSLHVAKAPPDGYTLVTATADTHSINPQVRADLPYDAIAGFTPLIVFGTISWAWMARADFPAQSFKELVELGKQKPGSITYGSWGIGSTAHVAGALMEGATGLRLNHVPFQGAAPALTAIQGSHIDLLPIPKLVAEDLRKAGKVKVFAVSSPQRGSVLSDVPTLAELGFKDAEAGSWYGIMGPKGLPEPTRARLESALVKVIASPEVTAKITAAGMDPVNLHGAAMSDFLKSEYARYGVVIRQRQIKVS